MTDNQTPFAAYGDRANPNVRELQHALSGMGLYTGEITGSFDDATYRAYRQACARLQRPVSRDAQGRLVVTLGDFEALERQAIGHTGSQPASPSQQLPPEDDFAKRPVPPEDDSAKRPVIADDFAKRADVPQARPARSGHGWKLLLIAVVVMVVAGVVLWSAGAFDRENTTMDENVAIRAVPSREEMFKARLEERFAAVLPAKDYQEMAIPAGHDAVSALYKAVDENGNELGHTVVARFKGYAGYVAVTLGIGADGRVTGAVIGDDDFVETAGLGRRWRDEERRLEQFKDIDTVEGGAIEAISGVTVTSNAVLNATNAAINCVNEVRGIDARNVVERGFPRPPEVPKAELTGSIYEGSAKGFASDVQVKLTMDDAGVVTGLVINSIGETQGFGSRATTDPTFAEQFIGKTAPFTLGGNIEALSGATVTSAAVVEAVNMACAEPVPEGALTGTAMGFVSDVTVSLTVDENNVITGIWVDASGEISGMGTRCGEDEAFLAQFIGMKIPVKSFDTLSGATVTSKAVVAAINATMPAVEPVVVGEPVAELTGTAKGFQSDVSVTVSIDANNRITGVEVDSSNETRGFGTRCAEDEAFLAQFIGKTIPVENFDVLSGATVTSKAVVAAINAAAPAVEAPAVPDPTAEILTAAAPGFIGEDVGVTVTLNEDGTIATLTIDVSSQVPPIGDLVLADEFINQFIGKRGPFVVGENVDVVSGATFSSNGAIDALNTLFPAEKPAE